MPPLVVQIQEASLGGLCRVPRSSDQLKIAGAPITIATSATTATEGRRRSRRAHGKAPAREAAREELEVEAAREEPAVAATSEQRAAATATMMAREGEER